jgi:molybdopterin/thiamine biosynthesis adenylyltransferase
MGETPAASRLSRGIGGEQRRRLRLASVLVVGVGGLGCPAAYRLACAGVGTIGLADPDCVQLSDLHRQILFTDEDVGTLKVEAARARLLALNPDLQVSTFPYRLEPDNVDSLFAGFDFVIDGTDNVAAKYLINDAAVRTDTPCSHAGILGFRGQTMTILPHRTACVRCLFPIPPMEGEIPTCQEAGIIGVVAGAVGTVQAGEAIKCLLGMGRLLCDRLLTFDALAMRWRTVTLQRNPSCPLCGDRPAVSGAEEHGDLA